MIICYRSNTKLSFHHLKLGLAPQKISNFFSLSSLWVILEILISHTFVKYYSTHLTFLFKSLQMASFFKLSSSNYQKIWGSSSGPTEVQTGRLVNTADGDLERFLGETGQQSFPRVS